MTGKSRLPAVLRRRPVIAGLAAATLVTGVTAGLVLRPEPAAGQPASVQRLSLPGSPGSGAVDVRATPSPLPAIAAKAPQAAVTAYLTARSRRTDGASFALLTTAARKAYPSVAQWSFALRQSPPPRSFTVTGRPAATTGGVEVPVLVRRTPKLDLFAGYVPAVATETYLAVREGGGWRVAPAPLTSRADIPADRGAVLAARAWLTARVACNDTSSRALQVSGQLLGVPDLAAAPCQDKGTWRVGAIQRLTEGPQTQPFVAAYGSGIGGWGRLVPALGPRGRFLVAVAPLGDTWRVFGLLGTGDGS